MEKYAGILRSKEGLDGELKNVRLQIQNQAEIISIKNTSELIKYFQVRDSLITQYIFLSAILDYHNRSGSSRGSFLINRKEVNKALGERLISLPEKLSAYNYIKSEIDLSNQIQTISFKNNRINIEWVKVRDSPESSSWFESVWKDFSDGKIIE